MAEASDSEGCDSNPQITYPSCVNGAAGSGVGRTSRGSGGIGAMGRRGGRRSNGSGDSTGVGLPGVDGSLGSGTAAAADGSGGSNGSSRRSGTTSSGPAAARSARASDGTRRYGSDGNTGGGLPGVDRNLEPGTAAAADGSGGSNDHYRRDSAASSGPAAASSARAGGGQSGRPPRRSNTANAVYSNPDGCPLCSDVNSFSTKATAMAHINKQHKDRTAEDQASLMSTIGMECYQCTICKKSYGTASNLATHITRRSSACADATMPEVAAVTNMIHDTPLTDDEYDACSRLLLKPLSALHPTWVGPMSVVMHELLGDMIVPNAVNRNVRGAQALMLLAGVLEYIRDSKEVATSSGDDPPSMPVMRVIDFLRKLTANPSQAASRILFVATSVKPPPPRDLRGGSDGRVDNMSAEEARAVKISAKAQALIMTAKMN